MDVYPDLAESLQVCGDPTKVSDDTFSTISEKLFREMLGLEKPIEEIKGDAISSPGLLKHVFNALISFTLEAAKSGVDKAVISSRLEECGWGPDRIQIFADKYENYKNGLEMELGRIGTCHPHIVDARWRLDYYIKDNLVEKVNKPMYLISLKTQIPGETSSKEVDFACSFEQLQDLVGKLKDATKTLEKAAQI